MTMTVEEYMEEFKHGFISLNELRRLITGIGGFGQLTDKQLIKLASVSHTEKPGQPGIPVQYHEVEIQRKIRLED